MSLSALRSYTDGDKIVDMRVEAFEGESPLDKQLPTPEELQVLTQLLAMTSQIMAALTESQSLASFGGMTGLLTSLKAMQNSLQSAVASFTKGETLTEQQGQDLRAGLTNALRQIDAAKQAMAGDPKLVALAGMLGKMTPGLNLANKFAIEKTKDGARVARIAIVRPEKARPALGAALAAKAEGARAETGKLQAKSTAKVEAKTGNEKTASLKAGQEKNAKATAEGKAPVGKAEAGKQGLTSAAKAGLPSGDPAKLAAKSVATQQGQTKTAAQAKATLSGKASAVILDFQAAKATAVAAQRSPQTPSQTATIVSLATAQKAAAADNKASAASTQIATAKGDTANGVTNNSGNISPNPGSKDTTNSGLANQSPSVQSSGAQDLAQTGVQVNVTQGGTDSLPGSVAAGTSVNSQPSVVAVSPTGNGGAPTDYAAPTAVQLVDTTTARFTTSLGAAPTSLVDINGAGLITTSFIGTNNNTGTQIGNQPTGALPHGQDATGRTGAERVDIPAHVPAVGPRKEGQGPAIDGGGGTAVGGNDRSAPSAERPLPPRVDPTGEGNEPGGGGRSPKLPSPPQPFEPPEPIPEHHPDLPRHERQPTYRPDETPYRGPEGDPKGGDKPSHHPEPPIGGGDPSKENLVVPGERLPEIQGAGGQSGDNLLVPGMGSAQQASQPSSIGEAFRQGAQGVCPYCNSLLAKAAGRIGGDKAKSLVAGTENSVAFIMKSVRQSVGRTLGFGQSPSPKLG